MERDGELVLVKNPKARRERIARSTGVRRLGYLDRSGV